MVWLTWRQHRAEALGALLVVAAVGAILLVLGLPMHTAFNQDGVASCLDQVGTYSSSCADTIGQFQAKFGGQADYLVPWFNLLPAMIGVFIGAPLLAREFEHGTWRLAWTQAVPRTRWLAVKLALLIAAVLVLAAAFTALFSWYRGPLDRLDGKFSSNAFDFEGLSIASYSLFALGGGTLAGVLIRRTVSAMAATLGGFLLIRIPVETFLRPHYQSPMTMLVDPVNLGVGPGGRSDWLLDSGLVNPAGLRLSDLDERHAISAARQAGGDGAAYLHAHGFHWSLTFQPASRFWEFQLIEASLFVVLAIILISAVIWRLRRAVG